GERAAGSERALAHAFSTPFGGGMGYLSSGFYANQDAGGSDLGTHDNGMFDFLMTLGMVGTLLYGLGISIFVARGMGLGGGGSSIEQTAGLAICLGFLAEIPLGTSLSGVYGVVFWLAAALLLVPRESPASGRTYAAAAESNPTLQAFPYASPSYVSPRRSDEDGLR
ncbi:MAG TPA: hypothetical protein VGD62_00995, partial [Acidobacteriaceae bacterium]